MCLGFRSSLSFINLKLRESRIRVFYLVLFDPFSAHHTLKVPYNFSYYLMRDFASNMWSSRPFLMYPRFLMKIITSQLDFGGIPAGYQRAELILQQNTSIALLRPTNKNFGLVTEQWVLLEIEYGDGIDID